MTDHKELVRQAKSSNAWLDRRRAIIQLSHIKDDALYNTFVAALADPVGEVRHAAIIALGRLGDRRAVSHLARAKFLNSPDPNIRWMTVRALGELAETHIIDDLVPLFDDEEWLVRNETITVLRSKVQEIIDRNDPSLARILVRMLALDEESITDIAINGLVSMESACKELLFDSLKSIKEPVRRHSSKVFGLAGDKEAVPHLIRALDDAEAGVRTEAAKALGLIADERAITSLIEAMKDDNESVRGAAVDALVHFGALVAEPLHSELAHTKNRATISTILLTLGKIQDTSSIPILIDHLNSNFYAARKEAVDALTRYGKQAIEPLLQKLSYNLADITALLKTARSGSHISNRIRALNALGDLEDHRAISILKDLITAPEREIAVAAEEALAKVGCAAWGRCGALQVIGSVGDESVVAKIIPSLKDDSPHVRWEAIRAIGKLKGKQAAVQLEKLAQSDPVHEVKTEALAVLREIFPGSRKLFNIALKSLDDPVANVRMQAARILGDYADARALQPLVAKLSDPYWSVKISAENSICNYGKSVIPTLLKHIATDDEDIRCRVISALARIGDESAIKPLEKLYEEIRDKGSKLQSITKEALVVLKGETGKKETRLSTPLC
ncbi:hypothetical protein A2V82_01610 [candidate division KSB1 bacterium RBG_16_48_16]|nr:MAG: hypothetical protein A2V82_01610 [candidate division KSB1 bacterium RBG_16_48_16]